MDEVIEFLGIPHDNRTEFPRVNENKRAKVTWLRNFYSHKPPPLLCNAYRRLKQTVGEQGPGAIERRIVDLNTAKERRPSLSPEFRAELVQTFRDEVALLSRILSRDLSHWA